MDPNSTNPNEEVTAATTSTPKKKTIPENVLFRPTWPNRHTRRAQHGGMPAPEKAGGVRKNPNRANALAGAALAYIQDKVTCKVWEIPVRPETSSEHRALIRRLIAEGLIVRDHFNPGYIHAVAND